MIFDSERVAFGRHETFPLRFSWLPKGAQALELNPKVFELDDSTVRLGVGRNMVNAMRYWLRAAGMIEPDNSQFTPLGKLLLDSKLGVDPYLEDEGTIWLLHWKIASNAELATTFFWFFNKFHKSEFTADELTTSLIDFAKENVVDHRRPAKSTAKSDASVLPRMYTQSKISPRMPLEEALDSPFSVLNLIEHKADERLFVSRFQPRPSLPEEILGYAVTSVMNFRGATLIPIEDLMYSKDNYAVPGSVFRLTENEFIRKLEVLVSQIPTHLDVRESNGIHQLFIKEAIDPSHLLHRYYESEEVAA